MLAKPGVKMLESMRENGGWRAGFDAEEPTAEAIDEAVDPMAPLPAVDEHDPYGAFPILGTAPGVGRRDLP